MAGKYSRTPNLAFTLIELMVVIAIVALTLTSTTPAMLELIHNNALRSEAARLLSAINLMRSEAISRNSTVSMCPSSFVYDAVPVCSRNYSDGWIIYTNGDKDREVDVDTETVLKAFEGLPAGYSLSNKAGTRNAFELISYLQDGSSRRNRTLLLCAPSPTRSPSWSIVMNRVGRPRLARGWGQCQ
ncbi:MAG: type IV fimbrial biogenesis protein FimT [Halioglobus sp.]|jgi:type IV fimbrial biogenesis protein FimT